MVRLYLFILVSFFVIEANAKKNDHEIIAVVGDDVISSLDVNSRVDLAIASSGLSSNNSVRRNLVPQIVKVLIDEKLYEQEAKRLGVEVGEQDIKKAIMSLEKRNKIKHGTFKSHLKKQGIPLAPALEQLRAQLTWKKILSKKISPEIVVTKGEIEEKMENISYNSGISELKISEIVLPINNDEKQVRQLASRLVSEINEGANFASVAKEFSNSSTSSSGGDMGWTRQEHIQEEILSKVKNLSNGNISDPFRVDDNYYILKLDDRRAIVEKVSMDDEVSFKQVFVEAENEKELNSKSKDMMKKISSVKSCKDFTNFANQVNSALSSSTIKTKLNDLNVSVRETLSITKKGSYTDIIVGPGGLYVFMICDRSAPSTSVVLEQRVEEMLRVRKLDLKSKQYLRKLRQNAFIEVRGLI